jgi:hypothetical protein
VITINFTQNLPNLNYAFQALIFNTTTATSVTGGLMPTEKGVHKEREMFVLAFSETISAGDCFHEDNKPV